LKFSFSVAKSAKFPENSKKFLRNFSILKAENLAQIPSAKPIKQEIAYNCMKKRKFPRTSKSCLQPYGKKENFFEQQKVYRHTKREISSNDNALIGYLPCCKSDSNYYTGKMFSVVPCTKIETTTQKNSNSKI
jgi:hypothetical protein